MDPQKDTNLSLKLFVEFLSEMRQGPGAARTEWDKMEKSLGEGIYRELLLLLTQTEFPPEEARHHWLKILEHRENLLDLLGWPHWLVFKQNEDNSMLPPLDVVLDNKSLEGFLHYFADSQPVCRLGCSKCGHCKVWSKKSITFNQPSLVEKYVHNMETNLRKLVDEIPSEQDSENAASRWQKMAKNQKVT